MDPNSARAEADRWFGISAKLLNDRDLVGSKSFALRARDADPTNPVSDQILAVIDTLTAAEKRVINSSNRDWYSILQLPHLVRQPELIYSHYTRLASLLNPDHNSLPFADLALRLVIDAWSVLSDPAKKWIYDSELTVFLHRSDDFVDQTSSASAATSEAASTFPFFHQQQQQPQSSHQNQHQWLYQQQQQQQQQQQLPPPQLQERQLLQQHHIVQTQPLRSPPLMPQPIPHKVQQQEAFNPSTFQLFQQTPPQPQPQQQQQQWLYHSQQQQQEEGPIRPIEQRFVPQPTEQQIPPQQRATMHAEQQIPPQPEKQQQQESVTNRGEEANGRGTQDVGNDCNGEGGNGGDEEEGIESFWTTCPYCYYTYEYPKRYQDFTLRCQNCRRAFQAVENLKPPPITGEDGKEETTFECWGCFPLAFSLATWKKSNPSAGGDKGLGSVYMPFTPMLAPPRSPEAKKRNYARGPVVYIDDDDVDFDAPYTSEDSDTSDDWYCTTSSTPSKKRKSLRGRRGRVGRKSNAERERIRMMNQNVADGVVDNENPEDMAAMQQGGASLGDAVAKNDVTNNGDGSVEKQTGSVTRCRAVTRSTAEKEKLRMMDQNSIGVSNGADSPNPQSKAVVQQENGSPGGSKAGVANKAGVSGSGRKQTGRGVRGRKKLDLNVEFSNEVEEHAPTVSAGNGEEEGAFFEGLDEFLSTLPLLHPVGDDKAKPS